MSECTNRTLSRGIDVEVDLLCWRWCQESWEHVTVWRLII